MVTINTIRKPIEAELAEFDEFVKQKFSAEDGLIAEMLEYVLSSRGKGIRPMLVMLSAALNSANEGRFGKRTFLAAMLVEMIHVASLIHDDVIDESDMRRGRASVNSRWQSRNAVIIGDYILAKNMDLGLSSGQFDLVSHIIKSMTTLCEGELIQSDHASKLDTSREAYFDIIYKKTASLLSVSASAGALSVGASAANISAMRRFGEAIGIAFQIRDDIWTTSPQPTRANPRITTCASAKSPCRSSRCSRRRMRQSAPSSSRLSSVVLRTKVAWSRFSSVSLQPEVSKRQPSQ